MKSSELWLFFQAWQAAGDWGKTWQESLWWPSVCLPNKFRDKKDATHIHSCPPCSFKVFFQHLTPIFCAKNLHAHARTIIDCVTLPTAYTLNCTGPWTWFLAYSQLDQEPMFSWLCGDIDKQYSKLLSSGVPVLVIKILSDWESGAQSPSMAKKGYSKSRIRAQTYHDVFDKNCQHWLLWQDLSIGVCPKILYPQDGVLTKLSHAGIFYIQFAAFSHMVLLEALILAAVCFQSLQSCHLFHWKVKERLLVKIPATHQQFGCADFLTGIPRVIKSLVWN